MPLGGLIPYNTGPAPRSPFSPGATGLGPLTSGTPNAAPDDSMAALEELLASLEAAPTPERPRAGHAATAFGTIGDALLTASRIMSGGQAPDMGPFARRQMLQTEAFERATADAEASDRDLRNRVRVGAFEMQQRADEAARQKADIAKAKSDDEAAQQMGLLQTANALAGQIPQLTAQGDELAKVIEGRGGPLNKAMANRIRQSIQGLDQFRQRLSTMPPAQVTPQLIAQLGQTKNDVDALLNNTASQLSQQDAANASEAKMQARASGEAQRERGTFLQEYAPAVKGKQAALLERGMKETAAQLEAAWRNLDEITQAVALNPDANGPIQIRAAKKQVLDLMGIADTLAMEEAKKYGIAQPLPQTDFDYLSERATQLVHLDAVTKAWTSLGRPSGFWTFLRNLAAPGGRLLTAEEQQMAAQLSRFVGPNRKAISGSAVSAVERYMNRAGFPEMGDDPGQLDAGFAAAKEQLLIEGRVRLEGRMSGQIPYDIPGSFRSAFLPQTMQSVTGGGVVVPRGWRVVNPAEGQ